MSKQHKRGFSAGKSRDIENNPRVAKSVEELKPEVRDSDLVDWSNRWRRNFTRVTAASATVVLLSVGFLVFGWGLSNQFVADDIAQLINNLLVHSLGHIPSIFSGSTFYGVKQPQQLGLVGVYYRPAMLLGFALIY